jgi:predicted AlkP superfamily phosphohydrolase/phosphomutase
MAEPPAKKILLVGGDAADWEIMQPLLDRGELPTMRRLVEEGSSASLRSLEPMLSPMLWTSIATGKHPYKHGIHGFTEPRPDGRGIRAAASTSRTTKAIWNILTQNKVRSSVVGWYASHPAEPIQGVCILNYYSIAPQPGAPWPVAPGTVLPLELSGELGELRLRPEEVRLGELQAFIPEAARIDPQQDDRLLKCAVILAETATIHAAATWILEHQPWEFLAVLYDGLDHFSHMFMDYHPPHQAHVPAADFANYRHVVATAYRFHDQMLARLLELAGDDVIVLLVSDHGFRSGEQRLRETEKSLEGLSRWHRPEGVCVLHGPGILKGGTPIDASLLDVTPTILRLFGLPLGDDMDGRAWDEVIDAVEARPGVPSWDEIAGDAGLHASDLRQSPADSLLVLRHLIELGYIAPPSEDVQQMVDECVATNQFNLGRSLHFAGRGADAVSVLERLVQKHPHNASYAAALQQAQSARRSDV